MNISTQHDHAASSAFASALQPYRAELQAELRRTLRTPAFVLPCLLFPVCFYLLFGVLLGRGNAAAYLLATYCVFGAMGPALFGFGVQFARDRELGLLALKRALPVPPLAPLLARLVMAVLFAVVVAMLLVAAAVFVGKVAVTPLQVFGLILVSASVALPLGAIGLLIGSHAGTDAATAWVNLVYLPLALLSGLWLPLSLLPTFFSTVAPLWPTWHAAQLALAVVQQPARGLAWVHAVVMLGVTLVLLLLAQRRLRRTG